MAHPDQNRPTTRPAAILGNPSIHPVPLPLESDSPPSDVASDDFLYHLSRGSELLKENLVEDAKEALEVALRLQPRDLRGQGLLGVVYFRLGLYPRAIDIYRQIVDVYVDEVTPKVNLALCYVKTAQHPAARELLEDVIRRDPAHHRAWAYLGLVYQFQRDFAKASAAFEHAGQHAMAERMRQQAMLREPTNEESLIAPERWELRAAAQEAFGELETNTTPFRVDPSTQRIDTPNLGRWRATEPGEEPVPVSERTVLRPSTPPPEGRPDSFVPPPLPPLPSMAIPAASTSSAPTRVMGSPIGPVEPTQAADRLNLSEWIRRHHASMRAIPASERDARTIWVELGQPFAVRATALVLVSPIDVAKHEIRVGSPGSTADRDEPLGGASAPIIGFSGPGRLLARVESGVVDMFELDDAMLTVRQDVLFGLSLGLNYALERLRLDRKDNAQYLRITGRGVVALQLNAPPVTLDLSGGGVVIRSNAVIGWTGTVLPEPVDPAEAPGRARGYVSLQGLGAAIISS